MEATDLPCIAGHLVNYLLSQQVNSSTGEFARGFAVAAAGTADSMQLVVSQSEGRVDAEKGRVRIAHVDSLYPNVHTRRLAFHFTCRSDQKEFSLTG